MAYKTGKTPKYILFWNKFKGFFKDTNLKLQLQAGTLSLVIFNYWIIFTLMTNQDITWKFPITGVEEHDRLGVDLSPPEIIDRFGSAFYLFTMLFNIPAIVPVFVPRSNLRNLLIPCLLWNVYMINTVVDNCASMLLALYNTNTPFTYMFNVFVIGFVVTYFLIKFFLNALSYFEYLKAVRVIKSN